MRCAQREARRGVCDVRCAHSSAFDDEDGLVLCAVGWDAARGRVSRETAPGFAMPRALASRERPCAGSSCEDRDCALLAACDARGLSRAAREGEGDPLVAAAAALGACHGQLEVLSLKNPLSRS